MAPAARGAVVTADEQLRLDRRRRWSAYALGAVAAMFVVGAAHLTAPKPFGVAFVLLAAVCIFIVLRPVLGVYAIAFFALLGDSVTSAWYPFTKNLSSQESILFVSDAAILSPLELVLAATLASWFVHELGKPRFVVRRGLLLAPILTFAVFVCIGLASGLARGGDMNVALWEARALLYLPVIYFLITNLLATAAEYEILFFVAIAGITIQSVLAVAYYLGLDRSVRSDLEGLTEHAATIHMSALLVFALALLLIPGCSAQRRVWVLLAAVPTGWAWALSQRRAAAIATVIGLLLLGVALIWKNRRAAVWFLPLAVVSGLAYTIAFWNATGPTGFVAQALKSVIAPESLSARDQSSNLYRQLEAYNIWFTIRSSPVRGIGFGNQFIQVVPLPDISFFPFWRYMPHNSMLWIWLKLGFFGFASLLFLLARTLQHSARSLLRVKNPDRSAIVLAGLAYVVMYIVYAYVDIAWDARSIIFLAVVMAIGADLDAMSPDATPTGPCQDGTPAPELEEARV